MNKGEIVATVAAYSQRQDLLDDIGGRFMQLAEARIGRDLETQENEKDYTATPSVNPFQLPSDFGKLISVEYLEDRGPRTLSSLDRFSINRVSQTGGAPRFYNMRAPEFGVTPELVRLDVRPFVAGTFRVTYYFRPNLYLQSDGAENRVSQRYPNVYLYATLMEVHSFERDLEQLRKATEAYLADVAQANKDARRAQSDKPAMRRA